MEKDIRNYFKTPRDYSLIFTIKANYTCLEKITERRYWIQIHFFFKFIDIQDIRVITKLPNSEQSYKGKVNTHMYINRQISQQPGNCENRNDPDLVKAFLKKWWIESDFKAPNKDKKVN